MGDYLFAALGALATVLGFGYWVLKATLVPREEFDKEIRAIENRLNAADLKTQQEHTSLASKQELKELEDALQRSVAKLEDGTKKISDKVSSIQEGLVWLIAKAGGKEETLDRLFKRNE